MKYRFSGPDSARQTFVFAHGAGVGMDAPFMEAVATGLGSRGVRVIRFEFPYMNIMRQTGSRRPPDRPEVLRRTFQEVIAEFGPANSLVIGGKSMGGRIASVIADSAGVAGVICLGYPFHPSGKPENLRTAHLESIQTPTLILQGERDPFGTREEIGAFSLSSSVDVQFIPDGEHSFVPRVSSAVTRESNLELAVEKAAVFLDGCFTDSSA